MDQAKIIEKLKTNDYSIEDFYIDHRNFFIYLLKRKMKVKRKWLDDIYTDAVMIFWQKCKNGELDNLNFGPRSYLVGIGRRLIIQKMGEKKLNLSEEDELDKIEIPDNSINTFLENQELKNKLYDLLNKIPAECKMILELYYFRNIDLNQINEIMKYPSINALVVKKHRCIKKLRSLINNCTEF